VLKIRRIMLAYIVLTAVYLLLWFITPQNPQLVQKLNLSDLQVQLLGLSVVLPLIIIWFAAFYGFARFRDYANKIKSSPDGEALSNISNGIGIFAVGLPLSSILNVISRYFRFEVANGEPIPAFAILSSYLSVFIALTGFYFIYRGATQLVKLLKKKKSVAPIHQKIFIATYSVLAASYLYFVISSTNNIRSDRDITPTGFNFLPMWVEILTIILPYILAWYFGLRAVMYLWHFQTHSPGVLYRQIIKFLAFGIAAVAISSILIQYFSDIVSIGSLNLRPLLVVIYLLLSIMAAGYLFIASGARRLKKVEEV
jgi:hypothetical protein